MKKIAIVLFALALVAAPAFAQARTSLNIVCNEVGAQVYLNGRVAGTTSPNFSILVAPATIQVRVTKDGFVPFDQRIAVGRSPVTINVNLRPVGGAVLPPPVVTPPPAPVSYSISVQSNVAGAEVVINGIVAGRAPFIGSVASGSYSVLVRAPGYVDYMENVRVDGNKVVTANLQPMLVPFSIGSLVPGAEIFLDGVKIGQATGSGDFSAQVKPGRYTLTVRALGFLDFTVVVDIGSGSRVVAAMKPLQAEYEFSIPSQILNPDMRGNPWSQIRLFIDGAAQKDFKGTIPAGRHTVTIYSGAFKLETSFDFEAGKKYVLEPLLMLNVKP